MSRLIDQRRTVYWVAGLLSCLLSWWAWFSLDVINTDAICYLHSAETIQSSLNSAMHLCNQARWPFYSIFIFGLQNLTQFSFLNTAFVLNGIFSLITVLLFVGIVDFLRVPVRVLWFAALTILLAHEFNAVKNYIVRDHGFWAFYLLSLFSLLQYVRKPQWHYALLWSLSLVMAALFRIEAVIFILLVPFFIWFDLSKSLYQRLKAFLQLNSLLIIALLVLTVVILQRTDDLGRLNEIEFQLLNGFNIISANFDSKANALAHHILSPYAESDASWVLSLMLMIWYCYCVTFNLSVVYTALVVYAWFKKAMKTESRARFVLWTYVLINVLITGVFLIENMYLSKRYLLALSLVLMMWVPFALEAVYQQRKRWVLWVVIFLMVITSLSGIFNFGYSKAYLRHSGEWLAMNVPKDANLYTNNYEVMYYSNHFGNSIFEVAPVFTRGQIFENENWKQYDYVAVAGDKNGKNSIPKNLLVRSFSNKRGDEVNIYKIPH